MGIIVRTRLSVLVYAVALAGCASAPEPKGVVPPGRLTVTYSAQHADGSRLKEAPSEVTLVTREATNRLTASQIGLNVLLLALGTVAIRPFSKDDLRGVPIEEAGDRAHLRNPVPTAFVRSLQAAVDARVEQEADWRTRTFHRPLMVGGGWAALVYDTLVGTDDPGYQISLKLDVYKQPETGWLASTRRVECSGQSEPPRPMAYWAQAGHAAVQEQLALLLAACQDKVVVDLPRLLQE